mmetsp:Transcript_12213/g.51463  ORF Transcript_12213/g.51463 Transcript_12213/m.51463 type:complete len:266 (-) Transcript_12213:90-887(-)
MGSSSQSTKSSRRSRRTCSTRTWTRHWGCLRACERSAGCGLGRGTRATCPRARPWRGTCAWPARTGVRARTARRTARTPARCCAGRPGMASGAREARAARSSAVCRCRSRPRRASSARRRGSNAPPAQPPVRRPRLWGHPSRGLAGRSSSATERATASTSTPTAARRAWRSTPPRIRRSRRRAGTGSTCRAYTNGATGAMPVPSARPPSHSRRARDRAGAPLPARAARANRARSPLFHCTRTERCGGGGPAACTIHLNSRRHNTA